MTTFRVPENVLPYPWNELKRPGEMMTEQYLLQNLLPIIRHTEVLTGVLQSAFLHEPYQPDAIAEALNAILHPLEAARALIDAWWAVAQHDILAEIQRRNRQKEVPHDPGA